MFRTLQLMLASLAICVAAGAIAAGDSIDMKVSGTIVPPGCVPTISSGGIFDYRTIEAGSLEESDFKVLEQMSISFSIQCDAPMKIAFEASDGRPDTVVFPTNKKLLGYDVAAHDLFGLGESGGKNIGAYRLRFAKKSVIDGGAKNYKAIGSEDGGATWQGREYIWLRTIPYLASQADVNDPTPYTPMALQTFSSQIEMQAVLNKASELDLTKTITLNGLATIQIIYL